MLDFSRSYWDYLTYPNDIKRLYLIRRTSNKLTSDLSLQTLWGKNFSSTQMIKFFIVGSILIRYDGLRIVSTPKDNDVMFQGKTDQDWEFYGKNVPYYGVVTWDKFKLSSLDDGAKQDFFKTGEEYINTTIEFIKENFSRNFYPKRALDFGCGVGRLAIPMTQSCESVTGIDVSISMLEKGRENCREYGIKNLSFVQGDDALSKVSGTYDFIHSYIVFQHIPRQRGEKIAKRLIDLLEEDGIGALHFTYFRNYDRLSILKYHAYKSVPLLWNLKNLFKSSSTGPMMQMNLYDLNNLIRLLQENGCHRPLIRFTNHGEGTGGVILYFQKHKLPML
ncbi:MAG: class I SAM-dependent methyltransferase [Thermosynechococcaceae cyanobacterium]